MYRSSRYRRTPAKRRFPSRNRTHEPKRSGHWQRGNIALAPALTVSTTADEAYQVLSLAQIPNLLGDYATAVGRETAAQIKFLEIGGIVFRWQFIFSQDRATTSFNTQDIDSYWQVLLASDRLDDLGNPVALTANWFTNTPPTVVTSAVETQDEETRYPTRVHYRDMVAYTSDEIQNSALVASNEQATRMVVRTQGGKSLRLRLRLDDEHGLFLLFHGATDNLFPSEGITHRAKLVFSASLYWRVVY